MFELHPAILQVFVALQQTKFPGLTEAGQNEALVDHATSVMRVVDTVFKAIGQADRFFDLLNCYADFHATKVYGFKPEFFWVILVDLHLHTFTHTHLIRVIYNYIFRFFTPNNLQNECNQSD